MSKRPRTLDAFFAPPPTKKQREEPRTDKNDQIDLNVFTPEGAPTVQGPLSSHHNYPFHIPHLTTEIVDILNFAPAAEPRVLNEHPDLDMLYYQPYIPKQIAKDLFEFLRRELPFYRVKYNIKRGDIEAQINTPRFTTVFGLDDTARWSEPGDTPVDAASGHLLAPGKAYRCKPRPLPQCLEVLRLHTENATGCRFNFALVNYYSSGADSISYHSDDEKFLGPDPAIASFTLGAQRDFLMKHKPTPANHVSETKPMKLPLGSGDMVLMRGKTQSRWLHSVPKRKGSDADRGRINITFRRAMVREGTENYYRYNVGDGEVYKWDELRREMVPWKQGVSLDG
ncbi:hypothetical protein LTR53_000224 [Teratosphaeriaceae sp. CCFEE 6253]|nr:hypothetical protein LTR53_000224 [Teratosphaeriaceae sp. CCFEE 6253]